jgi:hypothetical protein
MKKVRPFTLALLGMLTVCCLSSSGAFSQDLTATIQSLPTKPSQSQYKSLKHVLDELKLKRGIYFMFNGKSMKDKIVDSRFDAAENIETILTQMLSPVGLTYKKVGTIYVIIDANEKEVSSEIKRKISRIDENSFPAQNGEFVLHHISLSSLNLHTDRIAASTITGRITSSNGEGLPGVTVLVKGTTTGTSSGEDGTYSLTTPAETGTLIFSFIGFTTKEVPFTGTSVINVTLEDDTKTLDEVVVTALGIQKEKKALTYAVTEVSGATFTKAREVNLGNALSGRVAGGKCD